MAWVGKLIVDAVVAASQATSSGAREIAYANVTQWVVVELAIVIASGLVERGISLYRQLVGSRLGIEVNLIIMRKALKLDLRHFEDAKFYDKLHRARREASSRPLSLVERNLQIVRGAFTLIGFAAVLIGFSPWAVAGLLLAGVPAFVSEVRFSGMSFRLRNWRSPDTRRLKYIEHVLVDNRHVKEVKLFGIGSLLIARYRDLAETFYNDDRRLALRRTIWTSALSLVTYGAFYSCYLAIALAAAFGRISLGSMTLYITAFRNGQRAFQSILSALGGIYEDNLYMSNLFEFLTIPDNRPALPIAGNLIRSELGIRYEDVSFRYADTKEWVLRGISVFVPHGKSLALVGENGAGKTTFIKLLMRLYEPTEGRILLDGKDLREWDEVVLRRRISAIFQDFNRYQFTLGENVGFGCIKHIGESGRIREAIVRGGAGDVAASLSTDIETQLGALFEGGVELSGGQWQKVALARAFMSEDADVLVLDEPTAALDPAAENAVFERLRTLTRGRTAIIISHRFSTVRIADCIVVLEDGHIVEQGTHTELISEGGRYAQLFGLQATSYR